MEFSLNDAQRSLRDGIVKFATEHLNDGVIERDHAREFSRSLWDRCGEQGLQGLPVPEHLGGRGLDALSTAIALEALGYGCRDGGLMFAICAHLLACVVPVWKHGSPAQHERYLPRLCRGELIAVNAMTEPGTGSDVFAMQTRAIPDGDGFRISGTKTYLSNGPVADLAVVYALTDPDKGYHGGVTAFLVERGTPGYRPSEGFEKLSLRTCQMGSLTLEDVRVPRDAVLGEVGGGATVFTGSMDWERSCVASSHVGTMQRLLEQVVRHARTRNQFGQAIGKYQAVSHRIADMKVRLEASRLLAWRAASSLDRSRSVTLDASVTKLFVSEALLQTALDAVQLLGARGITVEAEVERALRDATASTIYSGTSEMQRNIISRWLGL